MLSRILWFANQPRYQEQWPQMPNPKTIYRVGLPLSLVVRLQHHQVLGRALLQPAHELEIGAEYSLHLGGRRFFLAPRGNVVPKFFCPNFRVVWLQLLTVERGCPLISEANKDFLFHGGTKLFRYLVTQIQ